MSRTRPYISVVVAVRNGADTLARCIASVIHQSTSSHELVVIDGGSRDGSLEILRQYSSHIAFWHSERDTGIANAWNKALRQTAGDWILFLGADDFLWNNKALASVTPRLEEAFPEHVVAFADVALTNKQGHAYKTIAEPWDRARFLNAGMYFSHQGVFHHRHLFDRVGCFDESFKFAPDYELLLRHLLTSKPVHITGCVVSAAEDGGISSDDRNTVAVLGEMSRARKKHGVRTISAVFLRALVAAHIKRQLHTVLGARRAARLINAIRPLVGREDKSTTGK